MHHYEVLLKGKDK